MPKRCIHYGCITQPMFNLPTETKAIYCSKHKKENMIDIKNKEKILDIKNADRIDLLVKIIKEELIKEYDIFIVKIIQIYYNDNNDKYENVKEEEITDLVCI